MVDITDEALVFPIVRVSQIEFDKLKEQWPECVGYPVVCDSENRVWPNPVEGIDLHLTEGAALKPFFVIRRVEYG